MDSLIEKDHRGDWSPEMDYYLWLTFQQPMRNLQSQWLLILKMASAQVVETSVTNNSLSQDSNYPNDLFHSRYVSPGFKRFFCFLNGGIVALPLPCPNERKPFFFSFCERPLLPLSPDPFASSKKLLSLYIFDFGSGPWRQYSPALRRCWWEAKYGGNAVE